MIPEIGRLLARSRRSGWARRLDSLALAVHRGYENVNYDLHGNGESAALQRLARAADIRTVFDVGANRGDWSSAAAQILPAATIHAFEIVPATFDHLKDRFSGNGNIVLNDVGLSDAEGSLEVYFASERDVLATCVAGFSEAFHRYQPAPLQARATTGDRYCKAMHVARIDFLKIDVEGFEPHVLKGFEATLGRGAVDVVQFEYGYINICTRFLLKDFYDYMQRFDMKIGKIYPDHVEFRPYRYTDEDFSGANFLAVRSGREDLLHALRGQR